MSQSVDRPARTVFAIPIEDKVILYRPLLQRAFVGNSAMAEMTLRLVRGGTSAASDAPEELIQFLEAIDFLQPDPAPPPPPSRSYRPTTAVLLLTNRCNLRCTYCYAAGGEGATSDLPIEQARIAIDAACRNAKELGRSHFELTFHGGGEPMQAWETLQEATRYARSKDLPCRVTMVTNGVWSRSQRKWILEHLDHVSVSFDGRQVTQDRQRPIASGQGSFSAVMRTLSALDEAEMPYGIRMTATAPWRGELPEDVRFICEETGCPTMQVEPAFNVRRGTHKGSTAEESEAFVDAFMEAFEIARGEGRQLTYSGARPWLLTHAFCMAPYTALIVTPAGDLVTCYEVTEETHPLNDLSHIGRVADSRLLLDEDVHAAMLDYLAEKRAACRDCFCYWHCAGDCYVRAYYAQAGDGEGVNPRCYMNREITARILLWYIMAGDGVWRGQGGHRLERRLMRAF